MTPNRKNFRPFSADDERDVLRLGEKEDDVRDIQVDLNPPRLSLRFLFGVPEYSLETVDTCRFSLRRAWKLLHGVGGKKDVLEDAAASPWRRP